MPQNPCALGSLTDLFADAGAQDHARFAREQQRMHEGLLASHGREPTCVGETRFTAMCRSAGGVGLQSFFRGDGALLESLKKRSTPIPACFVELTQDETNRRIVNLVQETIVGVCAV